MNAPIDLWRGGAAFASAFTAGAINSVAGGGTLITFPTLIWIGMNSITANATSTVGIWPGQLGGMLGYRRELAQTEPRFRVLILPSLIGGLLGAMLLRLTPSSIFDHMVPYLILFATLLFMAQETVQRIFRTADTGERHSTRWMLGAGVFQFCVGIYGGYFGAGIGILMLAALSILGLKDIHEMNSLKAVFGGCMNGIAALYFAWSGMVDWPYALIMAVAAITGGYAGAGMARKLGKRAVRIIVILVGLGMAISLFLRA